MHKLHMIFVVLRKQGGYCCHKLDIVESFQFQWSVLRPETFRFKIFGSSHIHFQKAYIPLNFRSGLENTDYSVNENGIPCCPNDPSLPMKHEGTSKRENCIVRYKFICPKVKLEKNPSTGKYHRVCHCGTPCTSSPSILEMTYIFTYSILFFKTQ